MTNKPKVLSGKPKSERKIQDPFKDLQKEPGVTIIQTATE